MACEDVEPQELGNSVVMPPTMFTRWRLSRFGRACRRWLIWNGTERIASRLHRWTRWTQEPKDAPRWSRRWLGGLNVACWTHVCGHGLLYSFRVGCIYWAPKYAKRVLNLPDQR